MCVKKRGTREDLKVWLSFLPLRVNGFPVLAFHLFSGRHTYPLLPYLLLPFGCRTCSAPLSADQTAYPFRYCKTQLRQLEVKEGGYLYSLTLNIQPQRKQTALQMVLCICEEVLDYAILISATCFVANWDRYEWVLTVIRIFLLLAAFVVYVQIYNTLSSCSVWPFHLSAVCFLWWGGWVDALPLHMIALPLPTTPKEVFFFSFFL